MSKDEALTTEQLKQKAVFDTFKNLPSDKRPEWFDEVLKQSKHGLKVDIQALQSEIDLLETRLEEHRRVIAAVKYVFSTNEGKEAVKLYEKAEDCLAKIEEKVKENERAKRY